MASEFYIGVKIGATLLASFGTALAGSKTTLIGLGKVADDLKTRQTRLGDAMAKAMAHPARNLTALTRQYDLLGKTIDQVRQKQARLAGQLAKGDSLRAARNEMKGEMFGTFATAATVAAPVVGSVKKSADFEAGLRDIAITGNLAKDEEIRLGATVRKAALATSQSHEAILVGVNTLVAAGMNANQAGTYSNLLGKVATATNADMKDLAGMVFSLSETLGIKGDEALKEAFNRAAYGGKLGRFELKDMAKALPEMTAAFAAKGIKGQEALTQIIASLEVGREGAGSGEEAVTNLRNWLSHMNTKHTKEAYTKAGVDYQQSMQNLVAGGYSSYEASLEIAQKFIASRGDGFMKQWKEAGSKGDEEAQRKLMESFGLSEVFQDIQTINHLLAMRQNWDKYQSNKKQMGSKDAMGTIDVDYQKRAELANKAWERFKTRVSDVGITIGNALVPTLTSLLTTLTPIIGKIGDFAEAHPGAIRAVVGFMAAVVGMKIATLALGWGLNFFVKSPMLMLATSLTSVSAKYTLFRALLLGGGSRLAMVFQLFGVGASTATKLATGFSWLGRGAMTLGRLLGGGLLSGIRLAGQAVLWLGRAMMMNPIGAIIMGIAVGAYLIWKYWAPIKQFFTNLWSSVDGIFKRYSILNYIFPIVGGARLIVQHWEKIKTFFGNVWSEISSAFSGGIRGVGRLIFNWSPMGVLFRWAKSRAFFSSVWNEIRTAFSGGILGIGRLILNWSPVGLFYRGFSAVLRYFGIQLPTTFSSFGKMLIQGLVGGITNKLSAAKSAIIGFGSDIKNWFANTLGIKSPSRVFMGFGDNIAEGAAIGIGRSAKLASGAAKNMAQGAANSAVSGSGAARGAGAKGGDSSSGIHIQFSPQITIQGGGGDVAGAVTDALHLSMEELERLIKRVLNQQQRRSI
jgi:hypothetical protein